MIILNLFSGVGSDIMAWERTDLPPLTKVYHAEIDPFALSVDRFLHPQVIQLGDVQNVKGADLGHVDLILAGSPCQGFSFSGKQLAFDDPRSKLFFEFVRILNELREINPKINFFLENVKMKKEFRDVITDQLGVHPIELNSALDSAQNRKRLYWASWGIMPQIDKGIMLGDILLTRKEIEETHYYGQKSIEYMDRGNEKYGINKRSDRYTQTTDTDKSFTVTANFHKGIPYNYFKEDRPQADLVGKQGKVLLKENIDKASCLLARDYKGFGNQGQTGVRCIEVGHAEEIKGHDTIRRVYSPNGKAPTLTTMQGGNREPKVSIGAFRGRYLVDGKRQDHKMKTQGLTTQRLEVRGDSKSNTLTTVQKDNVVVEEQIRWRALTPIECERLMTMEDNSTLYGIDDKGNQKTISKTQRYKMLGNGWVIDTIAHCLKYLEGRI
jgi:DNA (cytosine-5)-methyltransferase 3A